MISSGIEAGKTLTLRSVPEIAEAHGRSRGAIHSKLVAFGRVRLSYPPAEKG